jgi:hypothetical protein
MILQRRSLLMEKYADDYVCRRLYLQSFFGLDLDLDLDFGFVFGFGFD